LPIVDFGFLIGEELERASRWGSTGPRQPTVQAD
jgi:hypothetical protein